MVEIVYNPDLTTVPSDSMKQYNESQLYRTHVLRKLDTIVKEVIKDLQALHHSCYVNTVLFNDKQIRFFRDSLMVGDNFLKEVVFTMRNADMLEWLFNIMPNDSYMSSDPENIHEMKRLTDYIATRTD
jgi:hypothetical protein